MCRCLTPLTAAFATLCLTACGVTLQQAVLNGDQGQVASLIRDGAAVDNVDESGNTALFYAVDQGDADMVKLLLESGADPNAAAHKEHLDYFSDPTTPLIEAVRGEWDECARLLMDAGADVNALGESHDLLITSFSMEMDASGRVTRSSRDAEVWRYEDTALSVAVRKGNAELVKALLAAGADVGVTLSSRGMPEECYGGLRAGSCTAKTREQTLLSIARDEKHEEIVALLEEAGATLP